LDIAKIRLTVLVVVESVNPFQVLSLAVIKIEYALNLAEFLAKIVV